MKNNKNNNVEKYHQKVKVIDKIVNTKIKLKKDFDEYRNLKSQLIKLGKVIAGLRSNLNDYEDELVNLYQEKL